MSAQRPLAAAALTALLGGALAGCGVHADRRAVAGDVCVSALPVAAPVAGAGAVLVRVKHLSASQAERLRPAATPAAAQPGPVRTGAPAGRTATCAVAYRGRFDVRRLPANVPAEGSTGRVLVLLVSSRHPRVLGALVLPALPPELSR